MGDFLHFLSPWTPPPHKNNKTKQTNKTEYWKNKKKIAGDIIILLMYQKTIIWCMVHEIQNEIQSETDIIFYHFGSFLPFYPFTNPKKLQFYKVKKIPGDIWQSYDAWFLRYGEWKTKSLSFYARGYRFLHLCTTNDDHIRHGYWDMKCDRQNLLSFWAIFCPFTLLTTWKIKSTKKKKKHLEISSFYTCVQQMTTIWCMIPEIWSMTDIFFSF